MRKALIAVAAVLIAGTALAEDEKLGQFLQLELSAEKTAFIRGEVDAAKDLIVTVKVTNTADNIPVAFQRPELGPETQLSFDIHRVGPPTGEKYKVPKRVKIPRKPGSHASSKDIDVKDVALAPSASAKFPIDVGANYKFGEAGMYVIVAKFRGAKSPPLAVEILPLKRVDAFAEVLIERIDHFEMGKPEFPFMFYIVKSRRHWDEIVFLRRLGSPKENRYEDYRLARLPRGADVQIVAKGRKVALMAPDIEGGFRLYTVDMTGRMVKYDSKKVESTGDSAPALSSDALN